jgi:Bacterial Ig-like domain (group 3)
MRSNWWHSFTNHSRGMARSRVGLRPNHVGVESLEDRTLLSVTVHPLYQLVTAAGSLSPLASSAPSGYTPAQILQGYGVNQIQFAGGISGNGAGQTIAIVDAYDDPDIQSDLNAFSTRFDLPTTSSGEFTFTKVNQSGGSTLPAPSTSWAVEESLDVEWAHAIAPRANIVLVEATNNDSDNIFAAVGYAATIPGVSVVSMSFGSSEFPSETSLDSYFTTPSGHSNVAFVASAGDAGAPPEYPSVSPNVLGVGGTTLSLNSSGDYLSESAWSDGGGGISAYEPQPAFQSGIVTQSSTLRTSPDVAYDAAPNTGFPVYDSYTFGSSTPWEQVGGTSAGAPQWSALIAIADQGRALEGLQPLDGPSQLLPAMYSLPASDFHDITTGSSNSSTGGPSYSAGPGYDLVTGRGTPVANLLVPALVAYGTSSSEATSTALTSGQHPSVYGQPVTFTAVVSASGGTASGSLTFELGTTSLGTVTLTNGSASFTTSALPVGTDGVTAVYSGASPYAASTSPVFEQTVNRDTASVGVTSSANPSDSGQSVTFTATVSAGSPGAGTPTGTVTFLDDGSVLRSETLSGGSATFSTSALSVGSNSITVSYGGDGNFTASTSGVFSQTVVGLPATSSTVTSSANPAVYGQRVTFTATVKPASGSGTPTGMVTFLDGTTTLGTATLANGTASLATTSLPVGLNSVTASYGGSANYAAGDSLALSEVIDQDATTTTLGVAPATSLYGGAVYLTATVHDALPGSGTPTGTVTFYLGTTELGTGSVSGDRASFETGGLPVGSHSVTAVYSGDGNFTGGTSSGATQTVDQDGTTTHLSAATSGQSVTFTATVSGVAPGGGTPTGQITFYDGSTMLTAVTLSGAKATYTTTSLPAGSNSISASYSGNANFTASTSAAISETVSAAKQAAAIAVAPTGLADAVPAWDGNVMRISEVLSGRPGASDAFSAQVGGSLAGPAILAPGAEASAFQQQALAPDATIIRQTSGTTGMQLEEAFAPATGAFELIPSRIAAIDQLFASYTEQAISQGDADRQGAS